MEIFNRLRREVSPSGQEGKERPLGRHVQFLHIYPNKESRWRLPEKTAAWKRAIDWRTWPGSKRGAIDFCKKLSPGAGG